MFHSKYELECTISPITIATPVVDQPERLQVPVVQVHSILAERTSIAIGLTAAKQYELYTISRRVKIASFLDIVSVIVIIPLFILSPWFFLYVRHLLINQY